MNAIWKRTSVRIYEDREVEADKIEKLLRAAMAAPSAGNQQPWEFFVVTNRNKLEELSKCSPYTGCAKNAPVAIVNCYKADALHPNFSKIDLSACSENILLEAVELGLGAVWLGIAPELQWMETAKRILDIPDNLEVFSIIPCGYPTKEAIQQDRFDETRIHYIR